MRTNDDELIAAGKGRLRLALTAARRARNDQERRVARDAVTRHLRSALNRMTCVAAYHPLPTEPLDPLFLDELALTTRVLVPVVTGNAPLDWCEHPGPLRRGQYGINEPTGPRLGPSAITTATAILVPALAVDRAGHRLGRGGGHYDRTLDHLRRFDTNRLTTLIALIYDHELLDAVPSDTHDQPVTAVITPATGFLPMR
jgi:5-formyltetrahydrofolate cyclo-ligase